MKFVSGEMLRNKKVGGKSSIVSVYREGFLGTRRENYENYEKKKKNENYEREL